MGRFKLSSPDCRSGLATALGVPRLEWYFHDDSLDEVVGKSDQELVDMLLNFRSAFPRCSDELDLVSARFNFSFADLYGKRIVVTMDYEARSSKVTHETYVVRVVYLGGGHCSLLVNDL